MRDELQRMAKRMSGHLDEWYPEACSDRNAWLGRDGDNWERGSYWIDGLYPLARLLGDKSLDAKTKKWIDWTIDHQRQDGYIGPTASRSEDRKQPPPAGAQIAQPDELWPRIVMLKVMQQCTLDSGDVWAIECLTRYFHYQFDRLPNAPLHDPDDPGSGSLWVAQCGGDNLLVVLWLHNSNRRRVASNACRFNLLTDGTCH